MKFSRSDAMRDVSTSSVVPKVFASQSRRDVLWLALPFHPATAKIGLQQIVNSVCNDPLLCSIFRTGTGMDVPCIRITSFNRAPSLTRLVGEGFKDLAQSLT